MLAQRITGNWEHREFVKLAIVIQDSESFHRAMKSAIAQTRFVIRLSIFRAGLPMISISSFSLFPYARTREHAHRSARAVEPSFDRETAREQWSSTRSAALCEAALPECHGQRPWDREFKFCADFHLLVPFRSFPPATRLSLSLSLSLASERASERASVISLADENESIRQKIDRRRELQRNLETRAAARVRRLCQWLEISIEIIECMRLSLHFALREGR